MIEYLLSSVTILVFIILIPLTILKKRVKGQKREDSAYVGVWWFCVFILSFLLNLLAHWHLPKADIQSYLYTIVKCLELSIKMFVYNFDYESVRGVAEQNVLYFTAYISCYIMACLWTTIMAKNIFFKGITNEIKIWFNSLLPLWNETSHYIIIGYEKPMRLFLSDLMNQKDAKRITIITGHESDETNEGCCTVPSQKNICEWNYNVTIW